MTVQSNPEIGSPLASVSRCRICAVSLEKGGVGKTTTVATLGHALALLGRRVLLVDVDPQHNLTQYVGQTDAPLVIADVLRKPERLQDAITPSSAGSASMLNGNRETAVVSEDMRIRSASPYTQLRRILQKLTDQYDYILIDCPRTLDVMSYSALAAATEIIAPIDCEPMGVAGLGQIRSSLNELIESEIISAPYPPIRLLLTKYDPEPRATRDTVEYVRTLGLPIFSTIIRYSRHAIGAFPTKMTVLDLAPTSNVAKDYRALAEEFDNG